MSRIRVNGPQEVIGSYPFNPLASFSLSLVDGTSFHFRYTYIATAMAIAMIIARMTATIGRIMQRRQNFLFSLDETAACGEREERERERGGERERERERSKKYGVLERKRGRGSYT